MKRLGAVLAVLTVAVFALPALASAQTFCVHLATTGCGAGQTDLGTNLQKALEEANTGDSVLIGPGTFQHDNGFALNHGSPAPEVTITGAGIGQTVLESTPAHPAMGSVVFIAGGPAARLSGLTIHARPDDVGVGLGIEGATADGIAVSVDGSGPPTELGVSMSPGATVENSTIQVPATTGCCSAAVFDNSNGPGATLINDNLVGGSYGIDANSPETVLSGERLRITAGRAALADRATVKLDGVLASLSPPENGVAFEAVQGELVARSVTAIGNSAAGSLAARSSAGGGHTAKVLIEDSILRGFAAGYRREGAGAAANLTLKNDIVGSGTESGTGTTTLEANFEADPLFVNPAAGDYHLRFGSPAIDAGGDCGTLCHADPDLDGVARPVDGNGDGLAVRDLGAFEYGHRAPLLSAAVVPGSVAIGAPAGFAATASDPDPGDAVTLAWRFDDGATAAGASVSHAFASAGTHFATVTATDTSGLTSSATVALVVKAKAPGTKLRKAKVDGAKGSASFRFGASGEATGFECELVRKHAKKKAKFKRCKSPKAYKHLVDGKYVFAVRATGPGGHDATPAKHRFKIG